LSDLGYHVRLRPKEHLLIAHTPEERRIAAEVVLEQGRPARLVAFALPDSHLHALAICSRAEAGRLAQRIGSSLTQRLGLECGFEQYAPKPIQNLGHLGNTVRYILTQDARHGAGADPFREACNLPDLLGLRPLGAYTAANLRICMPRLKREVLLEWLGAPNLEPRDQPLDGIAAAALRAAALVSPEGISPRVVAARRAAAVVIGRQTNLETLGRLLGISSSSAFRLRSQAADPALVTAIRLQLGLEARLGQGADLGRTF
jgi:hypothetical protein